MLSGRRLAYVLAAALLLAGLPVGDATVLLALVLALDVAVAAVALGRVVPRWLHGAVAPAGIVLVEIDPAAEPVSRQLIRRTVPGLRMRRPTDVIAAQVRWRQAAEARHRRMVS